MMGDFRRTFHPTPEEERETFRKIAEIIRDCIMEKACCTCKHYNIIPGYHPGFVTGGDCDCDTGRCPIETCEEYELDPEELERLRECEKRGGINDVLREIHPADVPYAGYISEEILERDAGGLCDLQAGKCDAPETGWKTDLPGLRRHDAAGRAEERRNAMTKKYCDICGVEITAENIPDRPIREAVKNLRLAAGVKDTCTECAAAGAEIDQREILLEAWKASIEPAEDEAAEETEDSGE